MLTFRLGLLFACVLWAVSFIATKVALAQIPPLTVVTVRLLVSALCFALWLKLRGVKIWANLRERLRPLFVLSLFGTGLHYGSQTIGLQFTTASNASIYAATGPLAIAAISVFLLGERLTGRKILGISIAVVGVIVVMGLETLLTFDLAGHLGGDLLVFLSLVLWGLFTVYGKKISGELQAMEVLGLATIIGSLWMLPFGVVELQSHAVVLATINQASVFAVLFLGVGCSFLATLLYFRALQIMPSQNVGVYLYSIPPMTVLVAAFYLDEHIGVHLIVGAVLVMCGVYIIESADHVRT